MNFNFPYQTFCLSSGKIDTVFSLSNTSTSSLVLLVMQAIQVWQLESFPSMKEPKRLTLSSLTGYASLQVLLQGLCTVCNQHHVNSKKHDIHILYPQCHSIHESLALLPPSLLCPRSAMARGYNPALHPDPLFTTPNVSPPPSLSPHTHVLGLYCPHKLLSHLSLCQSFPQLHSVHFVIIRLQVIQVWQLKSIPFCEGTRKAFTVIIDRICKSSSAVAWSSVSWWFCQYAVPSCAVRIVLQLYTSSQDMNQASVLNYFETAMTLLLVSSRSHYTVGDTCDHVRTWYLTALTRYMRI